MARCTRDVVDATWTLLSNVLQLSPQYPPGHIRQSGQSKHWPILCRREADKCFCSGKQEWGKQVRERGTKL